MKKVKQVRKTFWLGVRLTPEYEQKLRDLQCRLRDDKIAQTARRIIMTALDTK